jgi:phosphoenolpyruvate carboxykinase (ATP)
VTRAIVRAIQDGKLNGVQFMQDPVFGFDVPTSCPDVPSGILDPSSTWSDLEAYKQEQASLAKQFIERSKVLDMPADVLAQNPKI